MCNFKDTVLLRRKRTLVFKVVKESVKPNEKWSHLYLMKFSHWNVCLNEVLVKYLKIILDINMCCSVSINLNKYCSGIFVARKRLKLIKNFNTMRVRSKKIFTTTGLD